jgi:alpha-amylase
LLLKNYQLSDDIAYRFSQHNWKEWPLTAEKFTKWLCETDPAQEVINLFMDYETFGEHQWAETGIFNFLKALPKQVFATGQFTFNTPSELSKVLQPISAISVVDPISWSDEERDLTAWFGNDLQTEAFNSLYSAAERMSTCTDPELIRDWNYLQTSDHFYYMSTKWFSNGGLLSSHYNAYNSPYEAFINYMNVVSDFLIRVENMLGKAKAIPKAPAIAVKTAKKPATKTKSPVPTKENLKPGEMLRNLSTAEILAIEKKIGTPALALAVWNDSTADINSLQQTLNKESLTEFQNLLLQPAAPLKTDIDKARKRLLEEVLKLKSR